MKLIPHSHFRRGTIWAFWGYAGAAVTGLGVNMLLTRLLSLEEMGSYFLALSLVTVLAMFARFGTARASVRLIAESIGLTDWPRARVVVKRTLSFVAFTGALVGLFLWFGGTEVLANRVFDDPSLVQLGILISAWVFLMTWQTTIAEVFRGYHDIRGAVIFGGLFTRVVVLLGLSIVRLVGIDFSLKYALIVTTSAMAANSIVSLAALKKRGMVEWKTSSAFSMNHLLEIAAPMFVTGSTLLILSQIDVLIVGAFSSANEVALYAAAKRLVLLVNIPLKIISAVLPPMIAQLNKQQRLDELEVIMRSAATAAGIPAAIVLLVIIFSAGPLMTIIYGEKYVGGSVILTILALGQMVNVWAGSCGFALNMTGHHYALMVVSLIVGSLVLVGSILCAARYGGAGVAAVVAAGFAVQNTTMVLVTRKKLGIWTHMDFRIGDAVAMFLKK
jgi:O-antigen/teichoic acid export membrane protein